MKALKGTTHSQEDMFRGKGSGVQVLVTGAAGDHQPRVTRVNFKHHHDFGRPSQVGGWRDRVTRRTDDHVHDLFRWEKMLLVGRTVVVR